MIVFKGKPLEALFKQSLKDFQSQEYLCVLTDRPKKVTLCCNMA